MAISADFFPPLAINGYYPCLIPTDVSRAKKNIDPANPNDGPFAIYKPKDKPVDASHGQKPIFDRDRIDAITRSARNSARVQPTDAGAGGSDNGFDAPLTPGQMVNLSA
jgi:hypothetical protein